MNEVFFAIWQNVKRYDEKRAAFTTWVAAVTRYQILKYVRRVRADLKWEDIDGIEISRAQDIQSVTSAYDEEKEFRMLLRGLSSQDQEIFMMLFWEELSREEISRHTGIKKEVLYNRISRGKKKIRRNLMEGGK